MSQPMGSATRHLGRGAGDTGYRPGDRAAAGVLQAAGNYSACVPAADSVSARDAWAAARRATGTRGPEQET